MGIDIRKELAQLRSMKTNRTDPYLSEFQATEYNSILAGLLAKGFDVAEFRIVKEDWKREELSCVVLPGKPVKQEWSEHKLSGAAFRTRLDGVLDYLDSEVGGDGAVASDSMAILSSIGEHFSDYVRPLTKRRRSGKNPFKIENEYDVQDLIEAALRLHFEDVKPEEPTPSYASKFSKMDFFLPDEGLAIEVKYVRDKGHAKVIGTEIIDDVARYDERPDCTGLIAYIYDPHHHIVNSPGVKKSLEKRQIKGNPISVYICN